MDEPVYLSALQYVPRQNGSNGRAKNSSLYVSMDGNNWSVAGSVTNWENSASPKIIKLDESIKCQYVKFVTNENWGDGRSFASAAMINLFEDITKKSIPIAEIEYDIKEKTNKNVTAKVVNPSTEITITNNNGSNVYIFKENGEFTFEFVNKYGNVGTVTAIVNWISKDAEEKPSEDEKESGENVENKAENNKNNIETKKDNSTFNGRLPNKGIKNDLLIKIIIILIVITLLGVFIYIRKKEYKI